MQDRFLERKATRSHPANRILLISIENQAIRIRIFLSHLYHSLNTAREVVSKDYKRASLVLETVFKDDDSLTQNS